MIDPFERVPVPLSVAPAALPEHRDGLVERAPLSVAPTATPDNRVGPVERAPLSVAPAATPDDRVGLVEPASTPSVAPATPATYVGPFDREAWPAPAATPDNRVAPVERAPLSVAPATPATYVGPFDREAWPACLTARVVSPGPAPRIHGYAVVDDLARHAGAAEVAWLTLRGELPTASERAAFEVAIALLAPVHIGQAPAHAAFLARISGAPTDATVAIGAIGLAELARHERIALEPWWAWLDGAGADEVPACARADADAPAPSAWLDAQLRGWFGEGRGLPAAPLHRLAGAHALLHRLGLRDPLVRDAIAVWARLFAVVAEAAHAGVGAVRTYPARVPDYQYVDDRGAQP
jgi:hypothetical protein